MITFKEWQDKFFPQMPELLERWKASGYSQDEMNKITSELVPINKPTSESPNGK